MLSVIAAYTVVPSVARAADVVRLGTAGGDDTTPVLYALDRGLFQRSGLDVQLQDMNSGSAGAAAVIGGALDMAKSSLMALVIAHARGIPLQIVAPGALYANPQLFAALVVAKASTFSGARALDGKTVAVTSLSDVQALGTKGWVDRNGGDSSSVKFLEIPSSAMVAALTDGRVDAAVLVSPILDSAVASGRVRVFGPAYDGVAKRFLVTGWYATAAYIARNADVARRFVAVMREASLYCNAHPADTLGLVATFEHLDPATLQGTVRAQFPSSTDPRDVQPVIDAAARYKIIDKPFPAAELIAAV